MVWLMKYHKTNLTKESQKHRENTRKHLQRMDIKKNTTTQKTHYQFVESFCMLHFDYTI